MGRWKGGGLWVEGWRDGKVDRWRIIEGWRVREGWIGGKVDEWRMVNRRIGGRMVSG